MIYIVDFYKKEENEDLLYQQEWKETYVNRSLAVDDIFNKIKIIFDNYSVYTEDENGANSIDYENSVCAINVIDNSSGKVIGYFDINEEGKYEH